MADKVRFDELLSELYDIDRKTAAAYIMEGRAKVNGKTETRAGVSVDIQSTADLRLPDGYSSRAAVKLTGALQSVSLSRPVSDFICIDIGASHGGFTGVLLEQGAQVLYAIDVAYGIFDYSLRIRPEVRLRERKNIKNISKYWFEEEHLTGPFLCVSDVSFMSVRTVLRSLGEFFSGIAENNKPVSVEGLFLCKPQFEASQLTDKGVIRDENTRQSVISRTAAGIEKTGFEILSVIESGLKGRKGNSEVFFYIRKDFEYGDRI